MMHGLHKIAVPTAPGNASSLSNAAIAPGNQTFASRLNSLMLAQENGDASNGSDVSAAAGVDHQQLVTQAQRWVAQSFYGVMLKQMHDSPFKTDLTDGGRGGQAFSALFDQHIIDRISRNAGGRLAQSIARRIEGRQAYRSQTKTKSTSQSSSRSSSREAASEKAEQQNPLKDVRIHVAPGL